MPSTGSVRLVIEINAHEDFDPEIVYPEIIKLENQMSEVLQSQPDPADEDALEDTILNSLVSMVYGSNMIERAGCDSETTWKLCMAIAKGQAVPEDIGETSEEEGIP